MGPEAFEKYESVPPEFFMEAVRAFMTGPEDDVAIADTCGKFGRSRMDLVEDNARIIAEHALWLSAQGSQAADSASAGGHGETHVEVAQVASA